MARAAQCLQVLQGVFTSAMGYGLYVVYFQPASHPTLDALPLVALEGLVADVSPSSCVDSALASDGHITIPSMSSTGCARCLIPSATARMAAATASSLVLTLLPSPPLANF